MWVKANIPLIAYKVLLALENVVQNLKHSDSLFLVSVLRRGNVFRMEDVEPDGLTEVWPLKSISLSCHLKATTAFAVPVHSFGSGDIA